MPAFLAAIPAWLISTLVKSILEWFLVLFKRETADMIKRQQEKKLADDNLKNYKSALEKGDLDEIRKASERLLNRTSS